MTRRADPVNGIGQEGRDELNLAEFPLSLLGETAPVGVRTVEYTDRFYDRAKQQSYDRKVIITGSDKFGLTTATDDLVLVALIQITREVNNFTEASMGWPDHRDSYDRVKMSLQRWLGLSIYFDHAWWDKGKGRLVSTGFNIIDSFTLVDGGRRAGAGKARFRWSEVPFRSLSSGWLKPLDLEVYFRGLTLPLARRLYRYLDKHFYHGKAEYELKPLAWEKAGMSRNYDVGQIKAKMIPAILELERIGFIAPMSQEERFFKEGRVWYVALRPAAGRKAGRRPAIDPAGTP